MPRLGIGKLVNRAGKSRVGRASTLALVGGGAAVGLAGSNISEKSFDMYSDVMLGNPQVDRALLGDRKSVV